MNLKILVLTPVKRLSDRLFGEFLVNNRDQIYCYSKHSYDLLCFKDGSEMIFRPVSAPPEMFKGYHFDQLFYYLPEMHLDSKFVSMLISELSSSKVPEEFRCQRLT